FQVIPDLKELTGNLPQPEPLDPLETGDRFVNLFARYCRTLDGIGLKRVVFIDDVLYTGRSIRAALTAIQSFGRPKSIELLTLIDRRSSRHLPIQPNYRGRQVDAINDEKVKVMWEENDG
ncbi:phosphoribosyltransferase family protein, partial [Psychroserpens mesophilus]|uniref:phosphoribosyltransferase family protein n=1 Tax=Psychroserpens mesophilus TaxID=325473 RepID=UPI003D64B695